MEADEKYIETVRCIVDQEKINQQLADSGMSESVLQKQIELNTRRHEMNIVDREEIVFTENEKEFVQ